ncbi:MAG: M23 family metallopeptidase [Clostridia bacterium]
MQRDDLNLSPFSASEPRQQYHTHYEGEAFRAWKRRRSGFKNRTGSMLAKIGICMAILGCVVLIQVFLLRNQASEDVVETAGNDTTGGGTENDDVLGRLRFVSAGGIKSVFSVSQRWDMPVANAKAALLDNDTMLCLTAIAGDPVSVAASGEVRSVAHDETFGDYVRINHGSELESIYYNLNDIRVEEGQPLLAKDTLGLVDADGKLYVEILRTGDKQNPAAYLNVE